jgi:hypothetical protein
MELLVMSFRKCAYTEPASGGLTISGGGLRPNLPAFIRESSSSCSEAGHCVPP